MTAADSFTAAVPKVIFEESDFVDWADSVDGPVLYLLEEVKARIEAEGIVTSVKALGGGLFEKKWRMGLRLYFAIVELSGRKTLLLLGSSKGWEQERAIRLSRKILLGYQVFMGDIAKKD